jgi:hypothetical protein
MAFLVTGSAAKMVSVKETPFIIVADVLQRLICQAWSNGSLLHPLSPVVPWPVLQYADDTLILCKEIP